MNKLYGTLNEKINKYYIILNYYIFDISIGYMLASVNS